MPEQFLPAAANDVRYPDAGMILPNLAALKQIPVYVQLGFDAEEGIPVVAKFICVRPASLTELLVLPANPEQNKFVVASIHGSATTSILAGHASIAATAQLSGGGMTAVNKSSNQADNGGSKQAGNGGESQPANGGSSGSDIRGGIGSDSRGSSRLENGVSSEAAAPVGSGATSVMNQNPVGRMLAGAMVEREAKDMGTAAYPPNSAVSANIGKSMDQLKQMSSALAPPAYSDSPRAGHARLPSQPASQQASQEEAPLTPSNSLHTHGLGRYGSQIGQYSSQTGQYPSHTDQHTSQSGRYTNQTSDETSQASHSTNQAGQYSSQTGQHTNQASYYTSQSGQHTNQFGQNASQKGLPVATAATHQSTPQGPGASHQSSEFPSPAKTQSPGLPPPGRKGIGRSSLAHRDSCGMRESVTPESAPGGLGAAEVRPVVSSLSSRLELHAHSGSVHASFAHSVQSEEDQPSPDPDEAQNLLQALQGNLGFHAGRPLAAQMIFYAALSWGHFPDPHTSFFQDVMHTINTQIDAQRTDVDVLAYWMTNSVSLLQLLKRQLRPVNSLQGAGLSQSMSASVSLNSGRWPSKSKVDAALPAQQFMEQLQSCAQRIFPRLRDSAKRLLAPSLNAAVQNVQTSILRTSSRSRVPQPALGLVGANKAWVEMLRAMNEIVETLKANNVPAAVFRMLLEQVFASINVKLFNQMLSRKECCTTAHGESVRAGLVLLEAWITEAGSELVGESAAKLVHAKQVVSFLTHPEAQQLQLSNLLALCPSLSPQQLQHLVHAHAGARLPTGQPWITHLQQELQALTGSPPASSQSYLMAEPIEVPSKLMEVLQQPADEDCSILPLQENLAEDGTDRPMGILERLMELSNI